MNEIVTSKLPLKSSLNGNLIGVALAKAARSIGGNVLYSGTHSSLFDKLVEIYANMF